MSRMLAYSARAKMTASDALGRDTLHQFVELSRLHADGWGTAWRDSGSGRIRVTGGPSALSSVGDLVSAVSEPATARIIYLRFASRGAPPAPENAQPFLRNGVAFQHNGLLSPSDRLIALLDSEHEPLRGETDSEVYFAVIRQFCSSGTSSRVEAVKAAVLRVREAFPAACLNAMMLDPTTMRVVHGAGTVAPPLAAFSDRGFDMSRLPPGHDADYNVLRTTLSSTGARVVATSGIDQRGWVVLQPDSVTEWDGSD